MPIHTEQLKRLNADYEAVSGKKAVNFFCPITLTDEPGAELCDGHILNGGIKTAARATVIQRKDVDAYFGGTIEPDLIQVLNMPVAEAKEFYRHAKYMTITGPSGEKIKAFFADKSASARFQQIDLLNAEGKPIASPFLREARMEPKLFKGLKVEWLMVVTNSAIIGSVIKSTFLACFWLFGYRWAFSLGADKVRKALAAFFHPARKRIKLQWANVEDFQMSIEERVSVLERELAEMKKAKAPMEAGKNWLEKISGSFKDDPEFGEILRLGQEIRKSDQTDESSGDV